MYNKSQILNLQKRREELKSEVDRTNDFEQMEELVSEYISINQMIYELNEDQSGKKAYEHWKEQR